MEIEVNLFTKFCGINGGVVRLYNESGSQLFPIEFIDLFLIFFNLKNYFTIANLHHSETMVTSPDEI